MNSNCAVKNNAITNRNTTMDTKALRQKILDLAIHGKLVPQDPNDEPASVLLERIKAEKERLIKEGKIKKSKKSEKTSDTPHYPYLLPEGWEWCRLNEIAESSLGKTLDKSRNTGKVYPYLCAINVKWNDFDLSVVKTIRLEDNEKERYQVLKGDLLICEGGDVGRSAIWDSDEPIYYQNALHRVRFFGNIVANFYLYLIWCYKNHNWIDDICNGVTIKHFTQDKINALYFPLPPVAEQQRIVAEIKRWFSLIDIIETGKDDLQTTIKQAKSKILDFAIHGKLVPQDPNDEPAIELLKRINPDFTPCDNGHYPAGWQQTILGELFNHNTGKALNSANRDGIMKDYLTTSNVYWNKFDFTVIKRMSFKESELDKCTVTKGDLLVCEGGDIGRSAIWNYDYDICIQNHIHRLRPKIDLCVPFYYYTLAYLKENNLIGGKGIGLLGLSSNALHKIEIPLPPLAEQQRIVQKIKELFLVLDNIQKALEM